MQHRIKLHLIIFHQMVLLTLITNTEILLQYQILRGQNIMMGNPVLPHTYK